MSSLWLPRMPDRHTGEPRPRHAPLPPNWKPSKRARRASATLVKPPDGCGPALEWYRGSFRDSFLAGCFVAALMLVVGILKDPSLSWVRVWWIWLFPIAGFVVFFLIGKNERMAAGADWFRFGRKFVKTYELVKITSDRSGRAEWLNLKDTAGRSMMPTLSAIRTRSELWDLVYNGILHSVYYGNAKTDERVRELVATDEQYFI